MNTTKIKELYVFSKKGEKGEARNAVQTVEHGGIVGDMHCDDSTRQISVLTKELIQWMDSQETQGLCFQRFKANIVLEGLTESVSEGTILKIGTAVLSISETGKSCFESCERYNKKMDCMLRENCYFAETISPGVIHVEDPVEICLEAQPYNWKRYSRQMLIPGIKKDEQEKIRKTSVLVIGAGGLGCPVLTALAEAGIGRIGIVDGDVIEESNLNRQYFYTPKDIGKSKARCAGAWVRAFRPDCQVEIFEDRLTEENGVSIMGDFDIVIAAVDTMHTRLLLNRLTRQLEKPFIDGAIDGFYGTVTAVLDKECPCLACLNPAGIEPNHVSSSLGTTTMMVGALEAQFAILYAAGVPFRGGSVLSYDGMSGTIDEILAIKNLKCEVCEKNNKL